MSAIYRGAVTHARLRPRAHRLRYRLFSLLLDLDELPALDARLKLLSVNRRNLFAFHEADHGDGSATPLKAQVDGWLRAAALPVGGRVRLLALPRILGYVFNPLSIYFCDAPDGRLQAIVYEVDNTFGERHRYLLPVDPAQDGRPVTQRCPKRMHVSPFIGMDAEYRFRIHPPDDDALKVVVDVHEAAGPLLHAAFSARPQPLSDRTLAGLLLSYPLLTLKVIAAIHWEALHLWRKRIPLHPRPPAAAASMTIVPPPSP